MVELLTIPRSSLRILCPKCDGETKYRRTGGPIYGKEGMYCWECKEYVEDMSGRTLQKFFQLKEEEIEDFTNQLNRRIKRLYLKNISP